MRATCRARPSPCTGGRRKSAKKASHCAALPETAASRFAFATFRSVSRRLVLSLGGALSLAGAVWFLQGRVDPEEPATPPAPMASAAASARPPEDSPTPGDDDRAHEFRTPSGDPSGLTCDEARAIIGQTRRNLAYAPPSVDVTAFASSRLRLARPSRPLERRARRAIAHAINRLAPALLASIEGRRGADCAPAREIGALLVTWIGKLHAAFDGARGAGPIDELHFAAADAPFEGVRVSRAAHDLAALLGQRVRAVEQGSALTPSRSLRAAVTAATSRRSMRSDGRASSSPPR